MDKTVLIIYSVYLWKFSKNCGNI